MTSTHHFPMSMWIIVDWINKCESIGGRTKDTITRGTTAGGSSMWSVISTRIRDIQRKILGNIDVFTFPLHLSLSFTGLRSLLYFLSLLLAPLEPPKERLEPRTGGRGTRRGQARVAILLGRRRRGGLEVSRSSSLAIIRVTCKGYVTHLVRQLLSSRWLFSPAGRSFGVCVSFVIAT